MHAHIPPTELWVYAHGRCAIRARVTLVVHGSMQWLAKRTCAANGMADLPDKTAAGCPAAIQRSKTKRMDGVAQAQEAIAKIQADQQAAFLADVLLFLHACWAEQGVARAAQHAGAGCPPRNKRRRNTSQPRQCVHDRLKVIGKRRGSLRGWGFVVGETRGPRLGWQGSLHRLID